MKKGRKIRHRLKSVLVAFGCLLLLSGCWDEREIEDRTSVVAIAVDKAKDGRILLTVQIPLPLKIAGGGASSGGGRGGAESIKVISTKGRTFEEAVGKIQYRVDQQLFFGQLTVIAFGEALAKEGLQNVIDALRRMRQTRRLMFPIIVEGEAAELMSKTTDLEQIPANFIRNLIDNGVRLGYLPNLTLGQFFTGISNTAKQPSMLSFKVEGSKILFTGVAAFKDDKLAGMINRRETSNLLRISRENSGGDVTVRMDDKGLVTFNPKLVDTNYDFSYEGGKVHASIRVYVEGEITELTFPVNLNDTNIHEELEKEMEKELSKQSTEMVQHLQEYGTDILGLGARIRAFHNGIWEKVHWNTAFSKAVVDIQYDVKIRRSGMALKNYQ
ncbi:MAG TPA: Ger(x)C family spore germination protein [Bacillales bacterium]|nr:Ger(x)C family spore germination protein [Bacillales bacterium]